MDRLRALDSLFLHVEDGITHMHIGSCSIFEGPAPRYDDVVALVNSKLPAGGLLRRRVDPADHRIVRLALSDEGEAQLEALSAAHLEELRRLQAGLRLSALR
jgi:hypothetical protein